MAAPFSIVHRLTALTAAVAVISLLFNGALMFVAVKPLGEDLTDALLRQIGSARATLRAAPAEQRAALAAAFSVQGLRLMREPEMADGSPPFNGPPPEPLAARVRDALGDDVQIEVLPEDRPPPGGGLRDPLRTRLLQAGFAVGDERWVLVLPTQGPPAGGPLLPVFFTLVLIGLATGLTLVSGIRLITQPIARIAREMSARHHDLHPIPEDPRLGGELQQVLRAFNDLVGALARAQEARRQLLAGLSHDLRTPLARLRLRAECECPEEVSRRMDPDFDALHRIINQFLGYARGSTGVLQGKPQPLAELVRATAQHYAPQGVQLEMDAASAPTLPCPDLAIQRLLGNLVDNALAHGQAPVAIVVEHDADECRLLVRDAGPGLPEGGLALALKPFVRLHADDGSGHCGLGLAIVAQIAGQLGGRVLHRPHDGRHFALGVALPLNAGS